MGEYRRLDKVAISKKEMSSKFYKKVHMKKCVHNLDQRESRMKNLKVIDLFAGCGDLTIRADSAGFNVIAAVENDPHAIASHKKNFPNTMHFDEDIEKLSASDLVKNLKPSTSELDGIIGGPPCQGFSFAGKQLAFNDPRSALFFEYLNI